MHSHFDVDECPGIRVYVISDHNLDFSLLQILRLAARYQIILVVGATRDSTKEMTAGNS